MSGAIELRHPPAFAGGRLLWWNRVLRAHAEAARRGVRVRLILDPALMRAADLRVDVQNARGDIVRLPAPEGGAFPDDAARAAFHDAVEDLLAPTAEQRDALALLLPAPGVGPLEAALALWPKLFPGLAVEAASSEGSVTDPPTDWTWLGKIHRKALAEIGIDAQIAVGGEDALAEAAGVELEGDLGSAVEALESAVEARAADLRPLVEEIDPQLVGAWRRMRRELRQDIRSFARSAERNGRNRVGLRRARLHQLAQGLRPLGLSQEQGLSLLAAAALFQLDPRGTDRYATSLPAGELAVPLLLDT